MADENNRVTCHWDGEGMDPYSCEPYSCHEEGTVWHLGADVPFCTHHYQRFEKRFGSQFPARFKPYSGALIESLIATTDRVLEASL